MTMAPEVLTIVGALASVLGAVIAALSKRALGVKDRKGLEITFEATESPEKDSRLPQVRDALKRQEAIVKWNGRASASLTFGQYIIGGLLASAFVQQSLTAQVVGSLGVLVLVSSLVHQHYRPDLQASGARQRMARLRALILEIEDDLFALRSGQDGAPTVYAIRKKASTGLAQAEENELLEANKEVAEATAA
jgi:hypothetical protein